MIRYLFFFLACAIGTFASCSAIPEAVRNKYASGMFEAFISQSYGKSTVAFFQFDTAREEAKKAGENILNLIAIEKLFVWYRMYGNSMRLFYKSPTGDDRIHGEYGSSSAMLAAYQGYQSEWGNSPEQAEIIRQFMLGVGEVIAGVYCGVVSGGLLGSIAWGVSIDGATRIFTSLNSLWAQHQIAMAALKNWEQTDLKAALK